MQTIWSRIKPEVFLDLIWVQNVCNRDPWTTLAEKKVYARLRYSHLLVDRLLCRLLTYFGNRVVKCQTAPLLHTVCATGAFKVDETDD